MKKDFFITIIFVFIMLTIGVPLVLFVILDVAINHFLLSTIFQIILYGGMSFFLLNKYKVGFLNIGLHIKSFKSIISTFFLGVIIFIFLRVIRDSFRWIYIGLTGDVSAFQVAPVMESKELFLTIIFFALIPSVFEELFFRILPYHILNKVYSHEKIIVVSAIIFSLFHINAGIESLLISFVLGIFLMKILVKGKSYLVVILIHFIYNFFVILYNNVLIFPTDVFFISLWAGSAGEAMVIGSLFSVLPLVSLSMYLYFKSRHINGGK